MPYRLWKALNQGRCPWVFNGYTEIELVPLIPNAMVQPVGMAKQWTLDDQANRVIKYRITQDLSYSETSKEPPMSINSRIDMDKYPEMVLRLGPSLNQNLAMHVTSRPHAGEQSSRYPSY